VRTVWHGLLRLVAAALLLIYVGWQVFWLSRAQIPPSLFLAFTGLPAATTGGTRSILQLLHGEVRASLRLNAMAVPMTLLFVLSVGWVVTEGLRHRRWRLPQAFLVAWLALLAVAWVIKLVQHAVTN